MNWKRMQKHTRTPHTNKIKDRLNLAWPRNGVEAFEVMESDELRMKGRNEAWD